MSQQKTSDEEPITIISPSCQEDSHVKTSVMLDYEKESMQNGHVLFLNKSAYCLICTQIMRYLRMSLDSADGDLQKCSYKLPRSGMMRNGILYRLGDLEHPIQEKGFSLLPTLTKFDATCQDLNGKEYNQTSKHAMKLGNVIAKLPLPTLTCRDYKGATIQRVRDGNPKRALDCEMQCHGMTLQPLYAEWHMGIPIGWTELNASEMPSSRSRSTRSSKQSQMLKDGVKV